MERICRLVCERIADRLRDEHGAELEVSDELVARLAADGFDEQFGARPLKRHVRRTLEKELTRAILAEEIDEDTTVVATLGGDGSVDLRIERPALIAA